MLGAASASSRGYAVRDCLLQSREAHESPEDTPGRYAGTPHPLPARDAVVRSAMVSDTTDSKGVLPTS